MKLFNAVTQIGQLSWKILIILQLSLDGGGGGGGGNFSEGDWWCDRCSVNNFARRTDCFKCHGPKDEIVGSGGGGGGGGGFRGKIAS